jgi:heme-degrading monooxygenase HmoA
MVTGPNDRNIEGEAHMKQHVRIATYDIKDGTFDELARSAREGMLRTFQEQPGFIRYGLADLGDRKCVSLSLWETHKEADASVPVAERWVREHIGDKVELRSTQIGDLAFFEGAPAKV